MWHAVGSSPLNLFSMSDCHFRQLRAGQGTVGSRDCRASVASAYGETALQTVFANAPSPFGDILSFAKVLAKPLCTLGSKLLSESTIAIAPLNRAVADTITTSFPPIEVCRHCRIHLRNTRLTFSSSALISHPVVIEQSAFMNSFAL